MIKENIESKKVTLSLRRKYIIALTLIALLTLLSQIIIQINITHSKNDSRVINIAGRQRMLSQRITKCVYALAYEQDKNLKLKYTEELRFSLELLKKSNNGLRYGNSEIGKDIKNSHKIIEMLNGISKNFNKIYNSGVAILTIVEDKQLNTNKLKNHIFVITNNEEEFLQKMDKIVFQYDFESKNKLEIIKKIEVIIMIFTLIALVLEAVFIFRVAEKKIEVYVNEIIVEKELVKEGREKLEIANKTKGKLLSIIGHDLKGNIGAVMQMFVEIEKDKTILLDEEIIKSLSASIKGTFELLENLLKWSINQTGEIIYNPIMFSIKKLITESINSFTQMKRNKNIIIIDESEDIEVFGDRDMIGTVLRNLISNAMKFSNNDSNIYIKSKRIKNFIEIKIEDGGVGMPEKILNKIFKIENNFSTKGTNGEYGTGLGLILCKDFVEKNGGEIRVESIEGIGSSFIFKLPLMKTE